MSIFVRSLIGLLSLSDNARTSAYFVSVLDMLMIDHQLDAKMDLLRGAASSLGIKDSVVNQRDFARVLRSVLSVDHSAEVNADFIRSVSSLLLLVDDPVPTHSLAVEDEVSVVLVKGHANTTQLPESDMGRKDG